MKTPLELETRRLVTIMFIVGMSICLLVFFAYSLMHNDWLEGALLGVSLAMALLPEEFPVVFTVFMSMVWIVCYLCLDSLLL